MTPIRVAPIDDLGTTWRDGCHAGVSVFSGPRSLLTVGRLDHHLRLGEGLLANHFANQQGETGWYEAVLAGPGTCSDLAKRDLTRHDETVVIALPR